MEDFRKMAGAWDGGDVSSFIAYISRRAGDRLWDSGIHDAGRIVAKILPECQAALAAWNEIYETSHRLDSVGYTRIEDDNDGR